MKRVLVLAPFWHGIGGAETFSHALVDELSKVYEVEVLTTDFAGTFAGTGFKQFWTIFPQMVKQALSKKESYDKIYCIGIVASLIGLIIKNEYLCRRK